MSLTSSCSFLLITCLYHPDLPSSSLQCFASLHSIMFLTSSSSFLLITCPYHLNLPAFSLQCLPLHIFRSFHSIMSLTSSSSFLLITCSYPDLPSSSFIFSTMFCFSSFHNVFDQFLFISSYYMSISPQSSFIFFTLS